MTNNEMIATIEAHRDGRTVQFKIHSFGADWSDIGNRAHPFNFSQADYRIKPEPREFWINVFHDQYTHHQIAHNTSQIADACAKNDSEHRVDCIHVREVI